MRGYKTPSPKALAVGGVNFSPLIGYLVKPIPKGSTMDSKTDTQAILDAARSLREVAKEIASRYGLDADQGLSDEAREILDHRTQEEDFGAPVTISDEKLTWLLHSIENPDFPTQRLRVSHLIQRLQVILEREGDLPIGVYGEENQDGHLPTEWAYQVEILDGAVIVS